MIDETILGRYECVSGTSDKYWHVIFDRNNRQYIAQWGPRTSSKPQGTKVYTEKEVRTKLREKVNKGYSRKKGYQTSVGENSIHFITCEDAA